MNKVDELYNAFRNLKLEERVDFYSRVEGPLPKTAHQVSDAVLDLPVAERIAFAVWMKAVLKLADSADDDTYDFNDIDEAILDELKSEMDGMRLYVGTIQKVAGESLAQKEKLCAPDDDTEDVHREMHLLKKNNSWPKLFGLMDAKYPGKWTTCESMRQVHRGVKRRNPAWFNGV